MDAAQPVTDNSPSALYRQRLADRTARRDACILRRNRLGTLRLFVFTALAAAIWYAFQGQSLWWLAPPVALFIVLVWLQSRAERDAELAARAIRFYERGLARLEHRWQGGGETGARFLDPHHPYSSDLDLFGRASLFELLSTARTRGGEARLASWLCAGAPADVIRLRHEAIEELRPLLDLRESLAVLAEDVRGSEHPEQLAEWAAAPVLTFSSTIRIAALVLSCLALVAIFWWLGTDFGADARLALLTIALLEAFIGVRFRDRIRFAAASVEEPARDLDLLSRILAVLEDCEFRSPHLSALRRAIHVEGGSASRRIAHLRRLVELLDSRDNAFVRVFGPVLLWTTQLGMALEAWRAATGDRVPAWVDAVSEIEALSSLANYAYEHPADPFPELTAADDVFDGEGMAHPLLNDAACVRNSLRIAPPLRLYVVSGSNMSGKSTLLRTIGINTVLALAGAPVRAKRLVLSHVSLGASIRTTDSLEEGHSRFMAEILRLKQVLELPAPALFLLDELLGGTNSHDRALGSEGLVRALLDRGAIGLVTTHDLSLSRVANQLAPVADNIHFEDRLEGGRLIFDYRIRPGIVERSNALDLMRAVGLDV